MNKPTKKQIRDYYEIERILRYQEKQQELKEDRLDYIDYS